MIIPAPANCLLKSADFACAVFTPEVSGVMSVYCRKIVSGWPGTMLRYPPLCISAGYSLEESVPSEVVGLV